MKSANSNELKIIQTALNGQNILELLKLGPHTRAEMVEALGLARSTIYYHLDLFMKEKIVEYSDKWNGKPGRPIRYFKLKEEGP